MIGSCNARLQVFVYSQPVALSDYNFVNYLEQNTAVYASTNHF